MAQMPKDSDVTIKSPSLQTPRANDVRIANSSANKTNVPSRKRAKRPHDLQKKNASNQNQNDCEASVHSTLFVRRGQARSMASSKGRIWAMKGQTSRSGAPAPRGPVRATYSV